MQNNIPKIDLLKIINNIQQDSCSPHILVSGAYNQNLNYVKKAMLDYLKTDNELIVIDKYGEYKDICKQLGADDCTIIELGNDPFINPLECVHLFMDDERTHGDFHLFLSSLFSEFLKRPLTAIELSVLNRMGVLVSEIINPTFKDLYDAMIFSNIQNEYPDLLKPALFYSKYDLRIKPQDISSKIICIDCSKFDNNELYSMAIHWTYQYVKYQAQNKTKTCILCPYIHELQASRVQIINLCRRARMLGCTMLLSTNSLDFKDDDFCMIRNSVNTFIILGYNHDEQNNIKRYLDLPDKVPLSFDENSGLVFQNGQIFTFFI